MKRVAALGILIALVVALLGVWRPPSKIRACSGAQDDQLKRFQASVDEAIPGAVTRVRRNQCAVHADAQLIARVPNLSGSDGLRVLIDNLEQHGWAKGVGLDHISPDGRDYIHFSYDGTGPVAKRPIDIQIQKVGYRSDYVDN